MKFVAQIDIMPIKELLDPQGKAVKLGLHNLGIHHIEDVRIGKHIVLHLEADSATQAEQQVETACKQLLANMIMEDYSFQISPLV